MNWNWREAALCRGFDGEIFFPMSERPGTEGVEYAKSICAMCPVITECLAFALETGQDYGVFGGLAPSERRELSALRKESA